MTIKIGNAPCSWGVIENVAGERSGYHRILDEISQTGYQGTELGDWGFMPTDPDKLKDELAARNLEMTGSWVNVFLSHDERYRESADNCLRAAGLLSKVCKGRPYINLGDEVYAIPNRTLKAGRIKTEDAMSLETRKRFMKNVNRLCKEVASETGVAVLFHHHVGTWIETPAEIDAMLNESVIDLCFDSGHCSFGGGNPLEALKKYRPRIGTVHFKDFASKVAEESRKKEWDAFKSLEHGVFPELGKGSVPFDKLVEVLRNTSYSGWITVEQDVIPGMGDPKTSAANNRKFIRSLGL